ncbi:MAG: N-methylproline demethylase, partial [Acetobacteraceae bacterium]
AEGGASVELVTPERFFAPEIGGLNHAAYAAIFARRDVRITINTRLVAARRSGNTLVATLGSDYGDEHREREVDQIVVEHGTLPVTDLYDELKPRSINRGELDYAALLAGQPQTLVRNPEGKFRLFRIGDAVASRNVHAAIYDALRIAKDL